MKPIPRRAVAAVIVSYRSADLVTSCLAAARSAGVGEFVVWDNSPAAGDRRAAEAAAPTDVTWGGDGRNRGFGGGVNAALDLLPTGATHVLLLNPDCQLDTTSFDELRAAAALPGAGAVAPRMRYPDGSFGIAGGRRPTLRKELIALTRIDELVPKPWRSRAARLAGLGGTEETRNVTGLMAVEWVSGFCCLLEVATLRELGGFDSAYHLYFEDVDLSLRLRAAGRVNYVVGGPGVLHLESATTASVGKPRLYWNGLATYVERHRSGAPRRLVTRAVLALQNHRAREAA